MAKKRVTKRKKGTTGKKATKKTSSKKRVVRKKPQKRSVAPSKKPKKTQPRKKKQVAQEKHDPTVITVALPTPEKKSQRWKYILAMFGLFGIIWFVGFCLLSDAFGTEQISLQLNDCKDNIPQVAYVVSCENEGGKPIEGYATYCSLSTPLRYMEGNITVIYFNGQEVTRHFQDIMDFNAPPKIEHITFNINGLNEYDHPVCLQGGMKYHYFTQQEYEERREKYVTYGLLLVLISLIAVPMCIFLIEKILSEDD